MAHLAVTDVSGGTMHAFDAFARAAAGLAAAGEDRLFVRVYDWMAEGDAAAGFPVRIRAAAGEIGLDLVLEGGKPPVAQGERGLSRKGPEPGNASFYYSLPRMPTRGTILVRSDTFEVRGASWMDREWSTSALSEGVAGWDWFALQLSDSTEVMLYRLRREDGSPTPFSGGALVHADGSSRTLAADEYTAEVVRSWRSPIDGTRYPVAWQVTIPAFDLSLRIEPVLDDQELNLAVRYWEGAVDVTGTRGGRPVGGVGYVELTGYGDAAPAPGGVR
jgi:predicted secreted hydrolase